jgi:hypothetical protein
MTDPLARVDVQPDWKPEPSVGGMGRPKRNRPTKASPARIDEIKAKKCKECRLCGTTVKVNAAHLIPKGMGGTIGGVWTESNIVGLCGSGNTGCHGLTEKRDRQACHRLRELLTDAEYSYVVSKMGEQWLDNRYPVIWEGAA